MVKNQIVMPYNEYIRVHQNLCNISGYLKTLIDAHEISPIIAMAALEAVRREALEALDLLEEDE